MGMGPMTGRGAGYCSGYGIPGYMNNIPGRGFGRGAGFGGRSGRGGRFGFGNRFYAASVPGWQRRTGGYSTAVVPPDPQEEQQTLRMQAEFLQRELDAIQKRLAELKTDTQNN